MSVLDYSVQPSSLLISRLLLNQMRFCDCQCQSAITRVHRQQAALALVRSRTQSRTLLTLTPLNIRINY
jgi:hypothetical protein